jgi:hypothetical protein
MITTVAMAGLSSGTTMRQYIVQRWAPSIIAASSSETGIDCMNWMKRYSGLICCHGRGRRSRVRRVL